MNMKLEAWQKGVPYLVFHPAFLSIEYGFTYPCPYERRGRQQKAANEADKFLRHSRPGKRISEVMHWPARCEHCQKDSKLLSVPLENNRHRHPKRPKGNGQRTPTTSKMSRKRQLALARVPWTVLRLGRANRIIDGAKRHKTTPMYGFKPLIHAMSSIKVKRDNEGCDDGQRCNAPATLNSLCTSLPRSPELRGHKNCARYRCRRHLCGPMSRAWCWHDREICKNSVCWRDTCETTLLLCPTAMTILQWQGTCNYLGKPSNASLLRESHEFGTLLWLCCIWPCNCQVGQARGCHRSAKSEEK